MGELVRAFLDVALIGLVCIGLVQATRLLNHLVGFRKSRLEMERFVHDFGATVLRAEAGIQNLKQAARDGGDDLEKLIDRATGVKDELHFICESADQLAERLTQAAGQAARSGATKLTEAPKPAEAPKAAPKAATQPAKLAQTAVPSEPGRKEPSSRAEKELMQALKKLS